MPALEISLDGNRIASVCTDGLDVLGANVAGSLIDDDIAGLNVCGSRCPDNEAPSSLTWIGCDSLRPGQQLEIAFREDAIDCDPGKTLDELFSVEASEFPADFKPSAEIFADLRRSPKLRDGFSFRLSLSTGALFVGKTSPEHHGFGLSLIWNSSHPERIRISLNAYTLDSLESGTPHSDFFRGELAIGDTVAFWVA